MKRLKETQPYLSLEYFGVHAVVGLEYLLCFLLRPEERHTQTEERQKGGILMEFLFPAHV